MLLNLRSRWDSIPSALTTWLQSNRDIKHEATLVRTLARTASFNTISHRIAPDF
jgi:hypothetical protein